MNAAPETSELRNESVSLLQEVYADIERRIHKYLWKLVGYLIAMVQDCERSVSVAVRDRADLDEPQ
jgi:hypothetical protein